MSNKINLTHRMVSRLCHSVAGDHNVSGKCYPIPTGGTPATYALRACVAIEIVDDPEKADFFFDDIIDSGETRAKWKRKFPNTPFLAIVDKTDPKCAYQSNWVVFPWEGDSHTSVEGNIQRLLQFIGEDTQREGLQETPKRYAKALEHWFSGYGKDPADVMKVFEDGGENYDQMVIVKDIPFYSHCEHHIAPIIGHATIAYIPDGKIIGLSKLSRLTDIFARRLQVQERLTQQIADALTEGLQPAGVGVLIKARHLCMESRGVSQQGAITVTTALKGVFLEEPQTRAEFLAIART